MSGKVLGCIADPHTLYALNSVERMKSFDVVFYGKLIEFNDFLDSEQIVTFEVIETYKGLEHKNIVIHNQLGSSCSRIFKNKGSFYYVYTSLNETKDKFIISQGTASFIPNKMAKDKGVKLEKSHI